MKRYLAMTAILAGCGGSDPVDAEGTYSISLTNGENGCNLDNWTVGSTATNIEVVITQQGDAAIADVMGLARLYLDAGLGGHTFSGDVNGSSLDLLLEGTVPRTSGNCTWTLDGRIVADLDGDVLVGRINYTAATNDHSDCAAIEGCITFQQFNGTRPPQ